MTDILEERDKRRTQILVAFGEIIRAMEHDDLIGPGIMKINNLNTHQIELTVPLKVGDSFLWEELLHE